MSGANTTLLLAWFCHCDPNLAVMAYPSTVLRQSEQHANMTIVSNMGTEQRLHILIT